MDNKEKVLVGAVCFFAGATVGFLLAPIKNKICFESFSCSKVDNLESDDDLENPKENKVDDIPKDEEIKEE